jgi:hypothetical protein
MNTVWIASFLSSAVKLANFVIFIFKDWDWDWDWFHAVELHGLNLHTAIKSLYNHESSIPVTACQDRLPPRDT